MKVLVSIIIPVFNTPPEFLRRCLLSVCAQTAPKVASHDAIEIIVVDDGSKPNCKSIIEEFSRTDNRVRYVRHWHNKGLVEARRTGIKKARGEYILMVDSDDTVTEKTACAQLYALAQQENADIVQCGAHIVVPDDYTNDVKVQNVERGQQPYLGVLEGAAVFENMFLQNGHSTLSCSKLIKKSVWGKAFAHIPHVYCVQNEDFLLYVLIAYYAKKYFGISERWYAYYIGFGISTTEKITSISAWKAICSSAKVFDILWRFMDTCPQKTLYEKQLAKYEQAQLFFILRRFHTIVDTSIKEDAWTMLCNAWGTQKVYYSNDAVIKHFANASLVAKS